MMAGVQEDVSFTVYGTTRAELHDKAHSELVKLLGEGHGWDVRIRISDHLSSDAIGGGGGIIEWQADVDATPRLCSACGHPYASHTGAGGYSNECEDCPLDRRCKARGVTPLVDGEAVA